MSGLKERETEILSILLKHQLYPSPVKEAAHTVHLSEGAIRMILYRLRKRYDRCNDFSSQYRVWRKKLGGRYL